MDFGFLGNIAIAANTVAPKVNTTKKERNPVTADIRVFKTGAVYPSAALVEKYNLEYKADGTGNGFDVFPSTGLQNTAAVSPAFIMIAAVPKSAPKVDLFSYVATRNGVPMTTVMEQGAKTFGLRLLQMAKDIYNVEPTEEKDYVDFNIINNDAFSSNLAQATNNVYYVPKTISRGDNAGQPDYQRRENLVVNILAPVTTPTAESVSSSTSEGADITEEMKEVLAEGAEAVAATFPEL